MKKTLGGDRLGSGSRMQVELHGYERSTHDLGYLMRTTMSSGTLVPFMVEVALPGDTFDINLDCDIKTHPTIGPLFGSYKVQLDVFLCPIRLYQGQLHNNKLGIGMNMANIKLPQIHLTAEVIEDPPPVDTTIDYDNAQVNPSSILAYLGIRGVGTTYAAAASDVRAFNGVPLLAYWDIYKNYYANKQEELGAVIHSPILPIINSVEGIEIPTGSAVNEGPGGTPRTFIGRSTFTLSYLGTIPDFNQIIFQTSEGPISLETFVDDWAVTTGGVITGHVYWPGPMTIYHWTYITAVQIVTQQPQVTLFNLNNLDEMREEILTATQVGGGVVPFVINDENLEPYSLLLNRVENRNPFMSTQEGLALKTYQSDLFNNWLSTEWIDGAGGINQITAIDTSGGSFTIDTLNLSKKVYDMLNRIAVSGGSYDDWLDAVWTHDRFVRAETPMYMGGLIKELVFQEVVSNSEGGGIPTETTNQPLGTLAGKGVLSKKHKGGKITVKVDEPSYIMGIVSLTPRIDYSQGNRWDIHLLTMDDFHKPALDEIGFQELITEQMAWWSTEQIANIWETKSAGKQPAWINYMTNYNRCYGNFAIGSTVGEMFMTLNRRYEWQQGTIVDLTTYIDPVKFNNIFAETALDAQNFWTQIAVDITARRKMSAKIMPNL